MVVSRRGASSRAPREVSEPRESARIVVGDCVAEMAKIAASSVDLVFADPPYNLQLQADLKRPDDSRVDAGDEDIQVRSDWTLPLCTGEERLKGVDGKKLHPTQKPATLLARVILSSSRPDDLVLDPFSGTGTTGAVAKLLRRRFIGFEREESYAKAAESRIAGIEPFAEASLAPFVTARQAPRVPF